MEALLSAGRTRAAEILPGRPPEIFLLIGSNRPAGTAEFRAGAGFHFHEHEGLAAPGDDVQLAAAGALAKVARHDGETLPAQEAVRQILAAAAMRLLRRRGAGAVTVSRGVRQAVKRNSRRCTQMHADKKACHGSEAAVGLICVHLRASATQIRPTAASL